MATRSNRHLIIEGPDGAGKSTLVKYLSPMFQVPIAPRISDSLKGVEGKNLSQYVDADMKRWTNDASPNPFLHRSQRPLHETMGSRIYDRYPLISEPIYGLHVRKIPQPEFLTKWYKDAYARFLALEPLVVWCLPPYEEVVRHVHPDRDMKGVWRNIGPLYQAYRMAALQYPGKSVIYDYTVNRPGWIIEQALTHFEI